MCTDGFDQGYLDRLKRARIDEGLMLDVLGAYAQQAFRSPSEREAFIDEMSEPPLGPQVRKAIVDVVFGVIAATELPTEQAFAALLDALEFGALGDPQVHGVQRSMLATMGEESSPEGEAELAVYAARIRLMQARLV